MAKDLQELNDSLVQHCDTDVEAFLHSIDQSVMSSRRVFHQFEREHIEDIQEDDWNRIQNQVIQRDTRDCPICLTPLWSSSLGSEAARSPQPQGRRTVLLSCSHIFHQICLEAFEGFCMDFRPTCPLCRSTYHKRLV
ncbi:RING finger protein 32 [Aplochiton taeniatus]